MKPFKRIGGVSYEEEVEEMCQWPKTNNGTKKLEALDKELMKLQRMNPQVAEYRYSAIIWTYFSTCHGENFLKISLI